MGGFSSLAKPFKKAFKAVKNVIKDIGHGLGDFYQDALEGSRQIGETLGYGTTSKKTKRRIAAAQGPVIPMPDEEEIRRARRRRYAGAQRSGRASTILSQSDEDMPLGGF